VDAANKDDAIIEAQRILDTWRFEVIYDERGVVTVRQTTMACRDNPKKGNPE
jgi:hypothetical protein